MAGASEGEDDTEQVLASRGICWSNFAEYLEQLERCGIAANAASMVGHGSIRTMVLGWDNRPPSPEELTRMQGLVAEAMEAGAVGISYGLMYPPGFFAQTDELVALAQIAARYGGFHAIHIRDERSPQAYRASVLEAIEIGEKAGLPAHVSHLEAHFPNWGHQEEVLGLLESARERGIDCTCDVPPYLLSSTGLSASFPNWTTNGGFSQLLARLRDPNTRALIRDEMLSRPTFGMQFLLAGNWDKAWTGGTEKHPEYEGKPFSEIARMRGSDSPVDIMIELLIEEGHDLAAHGQLHNEDDIRILVAHPLSMIESDSGVSGEQVGIQNPRGFGSFPMTFRKYVRGEDRAEEPLERGKKILTLQEAVRKMTSLPAQRAGLRDRGLIREGMAADIVVFDPDTITDTATYSRPAQHPTGIQTVLVNGAPVVDDGKITDALPGKVLRHS